MDVESQVFFTVNILIAYSTPDKLILIGQNSVVKFCRMVPIFMAIKIFILFILFIFILLTNFLDNKIHLFKKKKIEIKLMYLVSSHVTIEIMSSHLVIIAK